MKHQGIPFLEGIFPDRLSGLNLEAGFPFRDEAGFGQFPRFPSEIDRDASPGTESGDGSLGPRGGERGEKLELVESLFILDLTLEKHLGDGRRRSKVAVDLEGGMTVKEIGIGSIFQ